ncbi:MAG: peptidylprolyl isomerase [Verrucomicrobiota bacterium]|nr:peptidylprolyl isomerase [Verrucomicrobiota bacterium]
MAKLSLLISCFVLSASLALAQINNNPIVRFETELGNIDVLLLQDVAPNTVANFLRYVNRGAYNDTFIHRSVTNFVIQGGGYHFANGTVTMVPADPPIANEFHVSNTRGTLGMAKLGGDPNSATTQWFFNEVDNSPNLDTQNGGFTIFGRIIASSGLSVMDAIGALPTYNFGSPFESLPLRNYTRPDAVRDENFIHVISLAPFRSTLTVTRRSANTIHLSGAGTAGATYRLETSSSLDSASFVLTAMVTADSGGVVSYDDPDPGDRKLYRLVLP